MEEEDAKATNWSLETLAAPSQTERKKNNHLRLNKKIIVLSVL